VKIQRAKKSDIPELCRLNKAISKISYWTENPDYLSIYFDDSSREYYIIRHNHKIIAGMALDGCGEIEILCVAKKWRRKGLGTQLVNFAINLAREERLTNIFVGTYNKFNAVPFYKKLGFTIKERGYDGIYHYTDLEKCCLTSTE
jgi:GNAT superfamily N-acetyltransferase